jgi:protease I
MARAAIVLGEDFEDSEFETPHSTIEDSAHEVVVIGADKDAELHGKKGRVTCTPDVGIDDADPDDFDLLVVPGGYSPDKLRTDPRIVGFVRTMYDQGKPIAAICHAGSLLIEANVVRGVELTSWPSIKTDLMNAGADWVDDEVVEHGQFITSRRPDDLPAFTKAVIERLDTIEGADRN